MRDNYCRDCQAEPVEACFNVLSPLLPGNMEPVNHCAAVSPWFKKTDLLPNTRHPGKYCLYITFSRNNFSSFYNQLP